MRNNLIFNFDTRDGSTREKITGTLPTLTDVEIKKSRKGRAAKFIDTSTLNFPTSVNLSPANEARTIVIFAKNNGILGVESFLLLNKDTTTNLSFLTISTTGALQIESNTNGDTALATVDSYNSIYHMYIIESDNRVIRMWQDTQELTVASNPLIDDTDINSISFETKSYIPLVRVYDKILDAQERNKLYNEFLNSTDIVSPSNYDMKVEHKPVEYDSGLILFHNYENGNAIDATNNNNDGTSIGVDFGNGGASLNAGTDTITLPSRLLTVKSAVALVNLKGATGNPHNLFGRSTSTNYIRIKSDLAAINIEGALSSVATIDYDFQIGVDYLIETVLIDTTWTLRVNGQEIESVDVGGTANVGIEQIAGLSNFGLNGNIKFAKCYNYTRTLEQHKADYNKYAKQTLLTTDGTNGSADGKEYTAGEVFEY